MISTRSLNCSGNLAMRMCHASPALTNKLVRDPNASGSSCDWVSNGRSWMICEYKAWINCTLSMSLVSLTMVERHSTAFSNESSCDKDLKITEVNDSTCNNCSTGISEIQEFKHSKIKEWALELSVDCE
ncbi:hypothetical protein WICPIJ_001869 [Wickerhamomyces pijperi]|uniref:Uncharacterized protein n=1 Tax=Wickerhamomyces pijperi TaxID=599730 RepID=A0A9P8TQD6_WICPI|nr:hypothetical protein WICPIJ_001869 [Wickerhamomyces pijperi]